MNTDIKKNYEFSDKKKPVKLMFIRLNNFILEVNYKSNFIPPVNKKV